MTNLRNDSFQTRAVHAGERSVAAEIDAEIARIKLEAMGVKIDVLTDEQLKYLNSREEAT